MIFLQQNVNIDNVSYRAALSAGRDYVTQRISRVVLRGMTSAMSSKNGDRAKRDNDNRAQWERPAFRRLVAKYAEGDAGLTDDGNCVGTGAAGLHSCKIPH